MPVLILFFLILLLAALIDDEEKQELLDALIARPEAGRLIPGSGGLRKLRWSASGRGKRGGLRTIYFWARGELLFLLLAYAKNEKDDLGADELKALREAVRREREAWKRPSFKT